jgi:hypothetical protein
LIDDALRKRRDFATKIGALPRTAQRINPGRIAAEATRKIQDLLKTAFHIGRMRWLPAMP